MKVELTGNVLTLKAVFPQDRQAIKKITKIGEANPQLGISPGPFRHWRGVQIEVDDSHLVAAAPPKTVEPAPAPQPPEPPTTQAPETLETAVDEPAPIEPLVPAAYEPVTTEIVTPPPARERPLSLTEQARRAAAKARKDAKQ